MSSASPLALGAARRAPARLLAAIAIAIALGLAACGEEDQDTAASGADAAASAANGEGASGSRERVIIEAEDGAFDPHAIYEKTAPGVVTVLSSFGEESAVGGLFGGGGGAGQGSGFVLSTDGEIVTNAHVVTDAEAAGPSDDLNEAEEVYVQFGDRNRVPAEIVGFDPHADVGLIRVEPDGLDLVPLTLGDSDDVAVGDPVAAIGSPFGQEQSLSIGVVSATDRSIESLTRFQIDGALQTDASINPGNSGGPLLDAEGRVIGINQQINTTSGADAGVGFAVPSNLVERSIEQIREDGEADYAYIGVTSQALYPQLSERLDIDTSSGSLIARVVNGSPADEAGLEGGDEQISFQGDRVTVGGDIIVSVDGEEIVNPADLPAMIQQHEPGDTITLEVVHEDGDGEEVEVELEERPEGTLG